jgi:hypothetical protein
MLLDWCMWGLREKGMEGIGVREMGSLESPGGLFPGRIGSTSTEQGLRSYRWLYLTEPLYLTFYNFFDLFF